MKTSIQPLALISSLVSALTSFSRANQAMPQLIPVKVITYRHIDNFR
jgi:hypothetical protein